MVRSGQFARKNIKPDTDDLIIWLKYGELPSLTSHSLFIKSYALMQRGLYIQQNKARMYKVHQILKDIDYDKAQSLACQYNLTLIDFLKFYFSWIGLEKEFLLYTEEKAEKIIEIIGEIR